MQVLLFCLALLCTHVVHGWNIDPGALRNKCAENTPAWMEVAILKDLEPFMRKGISEKKIARTLEEVTRAQGGEVSCLVRVSVKRGIVEWETPLVLKEEAKRRLENFLNALEFLHATQSLPDLDFLISLADQYDRPFFLKFTKAPVLTVSKDRSNHRSLLIPNGLWLSEREAELTRVAEASRNRAWEEKMPIAFWRGSLSEGYYPYFDWDFKPRPQLVFFSRYYPDLVDAGFVENDYFRTMMHYTWQKWMKENQCVRRYSSPEMQVAYQYLIAIDGAAAPASLQWQLFSGSTLLKAESTLEEWFYADLKPNKHYMPFRKDSADLGEKIAWLKEHPYEAQEMAEKAREFAHERLSDEAIFLYTYKLLQAYSTLLK